MSEELVLKNSSGKRCHNDEKNISRKRKLVLNNFEEDANETFLRQILDTTEYERSVRSQTELEDSSSDGQSYKCPFCPMIEKGYTLLQNHVATAHFEDDISIDKSNGQCYFCGKSFSTTDNLVNITIFSCPRTSIFNSKRLSFDLFKNNFNFILTGGCSWRLYWVGPTKVKGSHA